ncbi:MAG: hypothetical protein IT429_21345 [Gemmataceae bacterium]|nr:hypothetical protein [Gemmataceae bacterium]
MNRAVVLGSGILLMTLLVGCGASGDDAIMKEQIGIMNEMATLMEKAAGNPEEAKKIQPEVEKLKQRGEEIEKKTKDWSKEKKEAMAKKYEGELKAAGERMAKAMMGGMLKGLGGKGMPEIKLP